MACNGRHFKDIDSAIFRVQPIFLKFDGQDYFTCGVSRYLTDLYKLLVKNGIKLLA